MRLPRVILASASPRRVELLRELVCDFEVIPSRAEETHEEHLTASEASRVNACRKAWWVARQHPEGLVIGADTLVYLETRLFGKPKTQAEARQMLEELQGRTHSVVTGVCLAQAREHACTVFSETTLVTFRRLSRARIEEYLAGINPLDKAGAYAIQEGGDAIVARVRGSFSNVVGLPLERLREEFVKWSRAQEPKPRT
jgi:septum formation protein